MADDLDKNGSLISAGDAKGRLAFYLDTSGPIAVERAIPGGAAGPTIIIAPGPPGGNLVTGANTAVAAGITAALPALPANPRTQIVAINNSPAAFGVVRKAGGVAGTGLPLVNFGVYTYSEGIVALEFENTSAAAAVIGIQWETS